MSEKFVVGKKYKSKHSGRVFECLFSSKLVILLTEGVESIFYDENIRDFTEYKEPVTIKGWVCVFRDADGYNPRFGTYVHPSKEIAEHYVKSSDDEVVEITHVIP